MFIKIYLTCNVLLTITVNRCLLRDNSWGKKPRPSVIKVTSLSQENLGQNWDANHTKKLIIFLMHCLSALTIWLCHHTTIHHCHHTAILLIYTVDNHLVDDFKFFTKPRWEYWFWKLSHIWSSYTSPCW